MKQSTSFEVHLIFFKIMYNIFDKMNKIIIFVSLFIYT